MDHITSNGTSIPALGFGVFRMSDAEVERVVPAALEAGFRHFDTAQFYQNEAALGRALKSAGVPRDELFLTTKVWPDSYKAGVFADSVDRSLEQLGLDQVDLLLLHWPGHDVPVADQVAMIAQVQAAGKTRAIGVSNYNSAQLREAAGIATIATDQVEFQPWLDQSRLKSTADDLGVALTAYYVMADGRVPRDENLCAIGDKYGKSAAQVALRWVVQQGVIALSKTANPDRVAENAAIFDFHLSDEDMAAISAMGTREGRIVSPAALAPDWD
ncbi:aldo/keto reductase [Sphingomonas aracearum]|uniref:Aldo/keto reductase n=1 Tax=Sphingomonas aracearum TaxID=2283317 RepID=A0A369VYM1_9SPHN|nr:aldo/keto reductase [Sphingomonas aracearum]RDE06727.1 aldo/keto reductase [Sphingomonas aracearum]